MPVELGDAVMEGAIKFDYPSNTAGTKGDAVIYDAGNDRVDATDAAGEDVFGILAEDAPASAGDKVAVWRFGPIVANAGGSVTAGDVLVTSSTEGQLAQNADATGKSVDVDGTTDQGVFAPANPTADTDSGGEWPPGSGRTLGANEAVVWLKP